VQCSVDETVSSGSGSTRRKAEQQAARKMLKLLKSAGSR
jgi:dsRNA-specific ribonuclease